MLIKVLPQVPPETARLAHAIFNEHNLYLQVGDQLCAITADFGAELCCSEDALNEQADHLLALITVFQFIEMLTDRQANEAIRQRLDWKYALHLPATFPAAPYLQTCQFRRRLLGQPQAMAAMQAMLTRMKRQGLPGVMPTTRTGALVNADHVVHTVCAINRLDHLAGVVVALLEYLAAYHAAWLRDNTQPGWYLRYRRDASIRTLPPSPADWPARFEMIGNDGYKLLGAIKNTPEFSDTQSASSGSHLARAVERELFRQFEEQDGKLRMRATACADCEINTLGL